MEKDSEKMDLQNEKRGGFAKVYIPFVATIWSALMVALVMLALGNIHKETEEEVKKSLLTVLDTTDQLIKEWVGAHLNDVAILAKDKQVVSAANEVMSEMAAGYDLSNSGAFKDIGKSIQTIFPEHPDWAFVLISGDGSVASPITSSAKQDLVKIDGKSEFIRTVLSGIPATGIADNWLFPLEDLENQTIDGSLFLMGAPIKNKEGAVIGAIAAGVDFSREITRLAKAGRMGATGETYIFDKRGRLLTESRFVDHLLMAGLLKLGQASSENIYIRDPGGNLLEGDKASANSDMLPLTKMAQSAVSGYSGIDLNGYRDYRGVEVVGAWRWDERLGFGITTEFDWAEAFKPYLLTRSIIITVIGFSGGLTLMLYIMMLAGSRQSATLAKTALMANELMVKEIEIRKKTEEAMRSTEKRLQDMMDNTTSLIYMKDPEGRYIDVNKRFRHLFKVNQEDVLKKTDFDIFPKKTAAMFRETDLRVLNSRKLLEVEETIIHDNADHTYISVKFPLINERGEIQGICGISTDITSRKRAEDSLKESERRFRRIMKEVNMVTVILDSEGRITFANDYLLKVTGYTWDELVGQNWFELFIEEDVRESVSMSFKRLIRGEGAPVRNYENEILTNSGGKRLVSWNNTELYDTEGNIIGTASLGVDITEQRKAMMALAQSELRFHDVAQNSGDWIWEMDTQGKITYSSALSTAVTGYDPEEITGKYLWDLLATDQAKILQENYLDKSASKRAYVNQPITIISKNGDEVLTETSAAPITDGQRKFSGYRGVTRNITERILAEKRLEESEAGLKNAQTIAHLGNWEWDVNTGEIQWTDEIFRIFGYTPQQFIPTYDEFIERIHPEDREKVIEAVNNSVNTGAEYQVEHRIIRPDGSLRYVLEQGEVYKDHDERPYKMVGVVQDITETKEANLALAESEERVRLLLESTGEAIYGLDVDGNCTFANPACASMLGYESPEDLLGKNIHDLIHHSYDDGTSFPREDCRIYQAFLEGKGCEVDDEIFWRKDGSKFPVQYSSYPIYEEGKITGSVVTFNDITERMEARRAIEENRQRLDSFMNSATDIFCLYDKDLNLVEINKAGLEMFNVDKKIIIGKNMMDLQVSGEASQLGDKFREVIDSGKPFNMTQVVSHPAHGPRYIQVKAFKAGSGIGMVSSDITEMKRQQEDLAKSNEILEKMFDNTHFSAVLLDTDFNFIKVNQAYAEAAGFPPEHFPGKNHFDMYPSEEARRIFSDVAQTGKPYSVFARPFSNPDIQEKGVTFWDWTILPVRGQDGNAQQLLLTLVEVTSHVKAQEQLQLAANVFENSLDGIMVINANGAIRSVNQAFENITGFTDDEAVGSHLDIMAAAPHLQETGKCLLSAWKEVRKKGSFKGDIWSKNKSGRDFPAWININAITGQHGQDEQYVAIFHDITEAKEKEKEIEYQAFYDTLTGLPNRRLFQDRLEMAVARARREKQQFALMFLDLDNFKNINDSLGHQVGDLLLKGISVRLVEALREIDTVARIGGDEFVILMENARDSSEALRVARKVISAIGASFNFSGKPLYATGSLGITIYPDDGEDTDTLLKNADMAMYKAKEMGKNGFQLFTSDMNEKISARLALENNLREAMEKDSFIVHYQPKVDIKTGRIFGVEALARWARPDGALVSPAAFIPIAEETGLILSIGKSVLNKSLRYIKRLNAELNADLKLSVNISARQLQQENIVEEIAQALKENGVSPEYLELEITESSVMKDIENSLRKMVMLKKLGVELSIDDFGTGFSSLGYLRRFPLDTLKIDRSFVVGLGEDNTDHAIVSSVISIAKNLGLKVVAEGVETELQMNLLKKLGCDSIQGYLYSPPVDEKIFRDVVLSRNTYKATA